LHSNPVKLRGTVAARLALVAVAVASVAGTAAFLKARRDVHETVLALALDQARSLVPHVAFLDEPDPARYEQARATATEHVLDEHVRAGHFVSIELYDAQRRLAVEATDPVHRNVRDVVEAASHEAWLGKAPSSRRVDVLGGRFLQVFAPLVDAGGRTIAHFDGIYELDRETLAWLDRAVVELVLAVVGAIFVTALVLYPVILRLQEHLLAVSGELAHANMAILAALGSAVAKRDRDTNTHNYRVTIYAIRFGVALGLSRDQVRALVKGAFLHDVGKIAVADAILKKPGPLTAEEKAVMQAHVAHGVEIVGGASWLEDAADVVRYHHEKVDGTGYPAGLKGEEIPVVARVFAIVDVFDALTSRRPYKDPASLDAALAALERGRGSSFDPDLLDEFLALAPDLHGRFCDRPEPELALALDVLLLEYFGVGASAGSARTLDLESLGVERSGRRGAQAAAQ
jgi:HD-GYP domain-containing protein (c-di-GMP phosphodiesterase class II)